MTAVLRDRLSKAFYPLLLLAIFIFSFFMTFKAGERGFFGFDQSIVFDGSYRILSGQIPYKDFIMPVGPVTFWLQAIFFKILGINYFSYIFGAALINVLATIFSVIIIALLFPSYRFLSYIAGLLTAIWFYPPFGTPWVDQTAFFFALAGITLILFTGLRTKRYSVINWLFLLFSGFLATLSFLSKQNAGLYILPLYLILLVAVYLPDLKLIFHSCFTFSCGILTSLILFFLWLGFKSDLKIFLKYFLNIPFLLGAYRLLEEKPYLSKIFFGGSCRDAYFHLLPLGIRIIMAIAFLIAIYIFILYVYNYKKNKDSWRKLFLSAVFCIYAIFFQYLFIHSTMNQAENGIPFIGIIFAIGFGLLCYLYNNRAFIIRSAPNTVRLINQKVIKLILLTSVFLSFLYLSIIGINISLTRKIQEFNGSQFPTYCTIDKLKALRWGQPTLVHGVDLKEEDIVHLLGYLKTENKNFFIFPNFTFLYALLNTPSPQALLWFHRGLTYHVIYGQNLDKWIVDGLNKNMVQIIIIDKTPRYDALNDFPKLKSYIGENFIQSGRIGIFDIYEKQI